MEKSPIPSYRRLVISGKVHELYEYSEPYYIGLKNFSRRARQARAPGSSKERPDNVQVVRRRIRRLVAANVSDSYMPVFLTLTFKENLTDLSLAHSLFKLFRQRFQYRFGRRKYLVVPEFQKRGAVHYHIIFFDLPYIRQIKSKVQKIWPHGFIKINAIKDLEFVGTYVSKYIGKMENIEKMANRKKYFCGRNLTKVKEYRLEKNVDKYILQDHQKEIKLKQKYETARYRSIVYTQYIKNNNDKKI